MGERFQELKEQAVRETDEEMTFDLPGGDQMFAVLGQSKWDGAYSTKRGPKECHQTVYALIDGEWAPIAQHLLQYYCLKCPRAVVTYLKNATQKELKRVSGESMAVFHSRRWPGISPDVIEDMLPELKACINHKVNMGCGALRPSCSSLCYTPYHLHSTEHVQTY